MDFNSTPTKLARLSILAAVLTIGLKSAAYLITDSVGFLSDAFESGVNLIAAVIAFVAIAVAALPPDDEHAYGHTKAEYFASGAEGALILVAAITIIIAAMGRFQDPKPLEQIGLGLVVSGIATILNLVVARTLKKGGEAHHSVALVADANHLFTDVWTSIGVMVGVVLVGITGLSWLDPLIAVLVAVHIVYIGSKIVKQSVLGLMDTALPAAEQQKIVKILQGYEESSITFHAMRTRQSGSQRFVSAHIQVPGSWTVQKGHSLIEEIEEAIRIAVPRISILIHLEPLEDPTSWHDIDLIREP
ncbi:MAG: cation diffusion facilitator family transporter [Candidatus Promineifilaceae bacterium]|jgi:cation diffusion facilitator family transporter